MKKLIYILGGVILGLGITVYGATSVFKIQQGGTGSSIFSPNTLIGVNSNGTALIATTSNITVSFISATSTSATSTFAYKVQTTATDNNGSGVTWVGMLRHIISGASPGIGQGTGLVFVNQDGNGAVNQSAGITSVLETSSNAVTGGLGFYTNTSNTSNLNERMRLNNAGNLGIGTTTPYVTLDSATASSTAGTIQKNPFGRLLEMTIAGVWYMIESFDYYGHEFLSGPVATCDANCTFIAGNDNAFRVKLGSAVTTATVTFAHTWGTFAPICISNEGDAGTVDVSASSTPTTLVLTALSSLTSKDVDVLCRGIR